MNVFVLCTGRCGSATFAKACGHITNYTAAHESNNPWLHRDVKAPYRSLEFPANHIEIDNRLAWFLGALQKQYGNDAYYVHLLRRPQEVAASLATRGKGTIVNFFAAGVLQYFKAAGDLNESQRYDVALQYWYTVNDNIDGFLRDKPRRIVMWLHDIAGPFQQFWQEIGATGDLPAALAEWQTHHNASRRPRVQGAPGAERSD